VAITNLAGEVAMALPPSVTIQPSADGSPTITNGVQLGASYSQFRFSEADVGWWGSTFPVNEFYVSHGITGWSTWLPYLAEFDTDAQDLEIFTLGTAAQYRLRIDGQYVGLELAQGPPADGHYYWLKIGFPGRQRRSIALEAWGVAFGGIAVGPDDHVYWPTTPLGPRCIVLGDSYTEGLLCYAQRLRHLLAWEVWSSGAGGTGYINSGPSGRVKFGDRVQTDVIAYHPDIVIVAGGLNDGGFPQDQLRAEALALYDAILTNLPSSKLIVVGPWWPTGVPADYILATRDTIKNAAAERKAEFVDPIAAARVQETNAGWITGTGNVAHPAGDGNADLYISADGLHPTDLGHQYLAVKLAERLKNTNVPNVIPATALKTFAGLVIQGRIGRNYLIQEANDVGHSNWVDAATIALSSNPQTWIDTNSVDTSVQRFYRAILLP
jgi:lysophospholipase L1-like esterase